MRTRRMLFTAALVAALLLLVVQPAFADAPRIPGKNSTSTNWSGYAAQTSLSSPQSGAVTDVKGMWVVPTVTSSSSSAYSSAWVGIDGYSSNTVEQLGTEEDWSSSAGAPRYYAWYEMYPKASKLIRTMKISAGDLMSAEVKYMGSRTYMLTITDLTTTASFTTYQKTNGANSSAEWVMEAPWSGGVLPLAQFGTIQFSQCSATISGHTGGINDSQWQDDPMTMINSSSKPIAVPSSLSSGGSAFSVTRTSN